MASARSIALFELCAASSSRPVRYCVAPKTISPETQGFQIARIFSKADEVLTGLEGFCVISRKSRKLHHPVKTIAKPHTRGSQYPDSLKPSIARRP